MYILWPNTGQGEISDLVTAQTLLFFLFSSRQMTKKKRDVAIEAKWKKETEEENVIVTFYIGEERTARC